MISNTLRITGMATGLDTDEIISKLMKIENLKADKIKQDITLLEWKRDSYREISNMLRGFKDEYFNLLKPTTNFRSPTAFGAYEATAKVSGTDTTAVTVKANASAKPGTHTLSNITLAQKSIWTSSTGVSAGMTGNVVNFSTLKQGKSFNLTLDGITKTITLDKDYSVAPNNTTPSLKAALETLVNDAFGEGNITISENGSQLTFTAVGHTLSISSAPHTYVSDLGFSDGQTNSITGNDIDFTSTPVNVSGNIKIDVNGTATDVAINISANNITEFVSQLQANIDGALGAGIVKVSNDGDKIKLISYNTSDVITLYEGDTNDIISNLGFNSGSQINKMSGTADVSVSDIGKELDIYVDGTPYHINLSNDYADIASLAAAIDAQIGAITVTHDGSGNLIFSGTNGAEIKIANSTETIVDELGFASGDSNVLDLDTKLIDANFATDIVFDGSNNVVFEINGTTFTFSQNDTINHVITTVNASDAGVTLNYSSLTDKFTLQSDNEGAMNDITFNDKNGTNLLSGVLGLAEVQAASDATFTLDGVMTSRSTNQFIIDGIEYTLNENAVGPIEITVSANPDELVEKIKNFVSKYNEVIDKINTELTEKRYRDYLPLTEEQKKAMSESDIELWEEKAKSGLLRSDAILQRIVDSMRKALYDSVDGVDIHLYEIGVTTSSLYQDRGKLVVDEEKLRSAIEDNPDKITQLFTKESSYTYEDTANRTNRYNEEGLAQRLYDIIQDNIRFTRDENGKKGILLEKAGIEGDLTEFQNLINDQIDEKNDRLDRLIDLLIQKENYYYSMFARMEAAIQSMNAQMSWLMAQTGSGGQ